MTNNKNDNNPPPVTTTTSASASPSASPSDKDELRAQLMEEINPTRPWLNHFCTLVSYFTFLVALMMAILEVCAFFFLSMTLLENILCFYIILFCALAIATETNLFNITNDSKVLKLWIFRGSLYIFIGILGLNAIVSNVIVQGAEFQRMIFRDMLIVFSCLMVGVGVLYLVMGLLCFRVINDRLEHNYQEKRTRAIEIKKTADKYGALSENSPLQTIVV
jgi:hypothetical protein